MLEPGFGWWGLCSAAWRGAARLLGVKIGVVTFYIGILTTSWLHTPHTTNILWRVFLSMCCRSREGFFEANNVERKFGVIF